MRLVAEPRTDWDVARRRALAHCASDERRRVPRTFWGSHEPRADAVAPCRAMGLYLIQMGVWCASATDVQPRERKTGCAGRDNRESSDASTRQRFRAPFDKGSVNGCPLFLAVMGLPPLECCRGTRPIQAASSRPFLKAHERTFTPLARVSQKRPVACRNHPGNRSCRCQDAGYSSTVSALAGVIHSGAC